MNYAPGITDQRAAITMQGNQMSQRQGEMMAQLAGYFVDRANKAKALRSTIKAYNPDAGDAVDSMGVDQLEGMLHGWSLKNAADLQQAHLQDFQAQAELRRQQAADDQSLGDAVNRYANAPDVAQPLVTDDSGEDDPESPTTMRPATPDERFRYALGTPGLSGRAIPKLIDALDKYGQNGAGNKLAPEYTEDPVTGSRALLYGKTAQPTGFNPSKAAPQLLPQHDEDGNLVGWSQLDAKGKSTFIPNKTSAVLKTARDESGNELPGYYVDNQGKLHDTRSALQKSLGTDATPKPAGKTQVQHVAPSYLGTAAVPSAYKAQGDVVADFKAGKLTRAQAAKILNEKFNVPLK
jgi:hypothetical protein